MTPNFGALWKSLSGIEIVKRDWTAQASHPPNPYFLWGLLKVKIEIFKWKVWERYTSEQMHPLGGFAIVLLLDPVPAFIYTLLCSFCWASMCPTDGSDPILHAMSCLLCHVCLYDTSYVWGPIAAYNLCLGTCKVG